MPDTLLPVLDLITDHLDRQAELLGDQDFMVFQDTRLSFAQTKELVDQAARALLAAGVQKQDRVAMMSNPRPEFFIHFLAVTSIGAIWVGLNPKYTTAELDHVVSDAGPCLLFGFNDDAGDHNREKLRALAQDHQSIQKLVLFDQPTNDHSTNNLVTSWEDFLLTASTISQDDLLARRQEIDPLDPAYLVYTSGSTGRPKGALLTHRGTNFCHVIAIERKGLDKRRLICNFPINHVAAIGDICGRTLVGGGTLFFQERFSPGEVLSLMAAERLNTMVGVPTMLQMCVSHPDFAQTDLTAVDLLAWGGSAMPAELLQALMDKTDCTRCTMGYGMTETTGGVTYSGLHDSVEVLATTIGTPDERQPLRIWHPDGRLARSGEAGEIQVKGDFTLVGYWQLPEATEAAFTEDGWFHTGDLAVERPDGNLQIVGRMSEMFKSGGYNVYPREVELALEEHPGVAIAAVISVPDPRFQEVGVAYVVGAETGIPSAEDLRDFAAQRLANYKVPKQILFLDELPLLAVGKVDKKALRSNH